MGSQYVGKTIHMILTRVSDRVGGCRMQGDVWVFGKHPTQGPTNSDHDPQIVSQVGMWLLLV